jgi:hypothetical protein
LSEVTLIILSFKTLQTIVAFLTLIPFFLTAPVTVILLLDSTFGFNVTSVISNVIVIKLATLILISAVLELIDLIKKLIRRT